MSGAFVLDARLQRDSVFIADGPLSQVRRMNDRRYPWLLLVPRVADVSEWLDLGGAQQRLLLAEINRAGALIRGEQGVQKLNIGALGNIVRQLHVHLIGRHEGDAAWPGPVWGHGSAEAYEGPALDAEIQRWRTRLA